MPRILILTWASLLPVIPLVADDWSRFRGAGGGGVSEAKNLPVDFGPEKNVVWKTELPPGHSSPVSAGKRIFLTGCDEERLITLAIDRSDGKIAWRKELPQERQGKL